MAQTFTTDVTQWQGVDDVPTAGSDNLVKSGGVKKALRNQKIELSNDINSLEETLQSVSDNGFFVTDLNGNIILKMDSNGLDAIKLTAHLMALINCVDKDDYNREIATIETLINSLETDFSDFSNISDEGLCVTDIYGNIVLKYDDNGLDVVALSNHIIDLIKRETDQVDTHALILRNHIKTNWPYYFAEVQNPDSFEMNYLEGKIASVPKGGKKFIFVTDTHWEDNSKKTNYVIDYVKRRLGINTVLFGGDGLDGRTDKYLAAQSLSDYSDEFFAAFGEGGIWVQGNHDCNGANYDTRGLTVEGGIIPDNVAFDRTVGQSLCKKIYDEEGITNIDRLTKVKNSYDRQMLKDWMKLHYYVDDTQNNIRYIILETSDVGYSTIVTLNDKYYNDESTAKMASTDAVMMMQAKWLAETLLSTPDGMDIVISGHWLKENNAKMPVSMLYAYKNKQSYTMSPSSFTWEKYDVIWEYFHLDLPGSSITFDFDANTKTIGKNFILCGHEHADFAFVRELVNDTVTWTDYSTLQDIGGDAVIQIVTTTNCAAKSMTNEDVVVDGYKKRWKMELNTITENAFDVVTLLNDKVVFTRIGAGEDREFIY